MTLEVSDIKISEKAIAAHMLTEANENQRLDSILNEDTISDQQQDLNMSHTHLFDHSEGQGSGVNDEAPKQ